MPPPLRLFSATSGGARSPPVEGDPYPHPVPGCQRATPQTPFEKIFGQKTKVNETLHYRGIPFARADGVI
jgi:hypothetical protein